MNVQLTAKSGPALYFYFCFVCKNTHPSKQQELPYVWSDVCKSEHEDVSSY